MASVDSFSFLLPFPFFKLHHYSAKQRTIKNKTVSHITGEKVLLSRRDKTNAL